MAKALNEKALANDVHFDEDELEVLKQQTQTESPGVFIDEAYEQAIADTA